MILKVAGITALQVHRKNDDPPVIEQDWWIYECDNIHWEIQNRTLEEVYDFYKPPYSDKLILMKHWCGPHGFCSDCSKPESDTRVVVAHIYNGEEEKIIVFDTIAYLCNNQGKTVEKIEP